ncbi:right-handed parallel beta-helix repeat-containing protein [Dactylosporangium sp. NPDC005572]|uniref:right-handed parallel beta-helix repeat-containing protein n=1 Tax=Dactylosporangium sp. NPDC005572 TaxID=3156889 RepID=UPI0033BE7428
MSAIRSSHARGGRTRSNLTLAGSPSNVTIVNNLFQNWPAKQAIANVNGTDITVNFNTIKATAGGAWTGIFGQGAMKNVTIAHNDIQNLGAAVDGIQLRFTGTGTDIEIAYNRISDNGRFPIELQQVAHGLKVHHNYATVRRMGGDQLGQLSIATGNDKDGGGYYDSDTSGVEIAYNIVVNTDGSANPACFESRGNGNVLHDNYCRNYSYVDDYAMTNNSSPNPWFVTNNVLVGPGSGAVSIYEGFNRAGYSFVAPTESGNKRYAMGDPAAPGVPAWNYAAGVQAGTP